MNDSPELYDFYRRPECLQTERDVFKRAMNFLHLKAAYLKQPEGYWKVNVGAEVFNNHGDYLRAKLKELKDKGFIIDKSSEALIYDMDSLPSKRHRKTPIPFEPEIFQEIKPMPAFTSNGNEFLTEIEDIQIQLRKILSKEHGKQKMVINLVKESGTNVRSKIKDFFKDDEMICDGVLKMLEFIAASLKK